MFKGKKSNEIDPTYVYLIILLNSIYFVIFWSFYDYGRQ